MNDRIKALQNVAAMARKFLDTVPTPIPIGWQTDMHRVEELIQEADDADGIPAEKAKLALAVAEPFHIEGMMVLSTAHVSEDTMKWLVPTNHFPLIVKSWSAEGTVVYVPWDQEAWNAVAKDNVNSDVPDDIFACMEHARAHGCCWLLLDADSDKVQGLALHEW